MSSRGDHRRRDRSWEKDDRDRDRDRRDRNRDRDRYGSSRSSKTSHRDEKRRSSRSRSPRRGDRDKERDLDRDRRDRRDRDYDYKRDDSRRGGDRDKRDDKRRNWDRDERKEPPRREDRDEKYSRDSDLKDRGSSRPESGPPSVHPDQQKGSATSSIRPSVDPNTPDYTHEDGEAMDDVNDDEAAMMAAMGLAGFGSTKGKQVTGNQEGSANVKKTRTWRQYMNRRGGFNRPLDKIK